MPRPACRLCGDFIAFAKTVNGKSMPINLGTYSDGNIVMEHGVAIVLTKDDPRLTDETVPKLKAHFATCWKLAKNRQPKEALDGQETTEP